MSDLKINVGSGGFDIDGYVSVDIRDGVDARALPYEDGSVDEIYASHVLEHLGWKDVGETLKHWWKLLKPGGKVKIAVPDFSRIADLLNDQNFQYMLATAMGGQTHEHDFHKSAFNEKALTWWLNQCGFGNVRPFEPIAEDTSTHPVSLNLEATKRFWPTVENPKVCLILSEPRIGIAGCQRRLRAMVKELQCDEMYVGGAFWDKCIERGTKSALSAEKYDFFLYWDYDSIASVEDVKLMLATINHNPTMAAIVPVQMSRHKPEPLVFQQHLDYTTDLTKVTYGHFGCTIIRPQVFKELGDGPWFWSIPGETGWDDGWTSDADITFWRLLSSKGLEVYQCNKAVLGHVEFAVIWPGTGGEFYQLLPHYEVKGRPEAVAFDPEVFKKRDESESKKSSA